MIPFDSIRFEKQVREADELKTQTKQKNKIYLDRLENLKSSFVVVCLLLFLKIFFVEKIRIKNQGFVNKSYNEMRESTLLQSNLFWIN